MTSTLRPAFYFSALGHDGDFDTITRGQVTKDYTTMASNGDHPNKSGNAERWALITSAYNELKAIFAKKRGKYTSHSDEGWLAAWETLNGVKREAPKAEPSFSTTSEGETEKYHFVKREGESKEDARKRCARERQQFYYARDPKYAAKRRAASVNSHAAKRARDKAAKEAANA